MKFEFQVFGQRLLITENNPSQAGIHKTEFMTGTASSVISLKRGWAIRIDTFDTGDFKAEFDAWCCERTKHSTTCPIEMNRDINAGLFLVFIEDRSDFFNGFVVSCVRRSENDKDS